MAAVERPSYREALAKVEQIARQQYTLNVDQQMRRAQERSEEFGDELMAVWQRKISQLPELAVRSRFLTKSALDDEMVAARRARSDLVNFEDSVERVLGPLSMSSEHDACLVRLACGMLLGNVLLRSKQRLAELSEVAFQPLDEDTLRRLLESDGEIAQEEVTAWSAQADKEDFGSYVEESPALDPFLFQDSHAEYAFASPGVHPVSAQFSSSGGYDDGADSGDDDAPALPARNKRPLAPDYQTVPRREEPQYEEPPLSSPVRVDPVFVQHAAASHVATAGQVAHTVTLTHVAEEFADFKRSQEFETLPWFHGNISRHAAEEALRSAAKENPGHCCFLLRKSPNAPRDHIMSLVRSTNGRYGAMHLRVVAVLRGDGSPFSSYACEVQGVLTPLCESWYELVKYFEDHPLPVGVPSFPVTPEAGGRKPAPATRVAGASQAGVDTDGEEYLAFPVQPLTAERIQASRQSMSFDSGASSTDDAPPHSYNQMQAGNWEDRPSLRAGGGSGGSLRQANPLNAQPGTVTKAALPSEFAGRNPLLARPGKVTRLPSQKPQYQAQQQQQPPRVQYGEATVLHPAKYASSEDARQQMLAKAQAENAKRAEAYRLQDQRQASQRSTQAPQAAQQRPLGASSSVRQPSEPQPDEEWLVVEGYLNKLRGFGQSRRRWFRLTSQRFTYFTKDADEAIATVMLSDVSAVTAVAKDRLRVVTKQAFGAGNHLEMLLEAPTPNVRAKWLDAFTQMLSQPTMHDMRDMPGVTLAEGYLTKVVPGPSVSKVRWFRLTTKAFAYFKEEGGDQMGIVKTDNVTTVGLDAGDNKVFRIITNQRFTRGGHFEVTLKCESQSARNKWLVALRRAVASDKFQR